MNVKEKLHIKAWELIQGSVQMAAWNLIVEAAEMYAKTIKADSKLMGKDVDEIAESIELALSIIREE